MLLVESMTSESVVEQALRLPLLERLQERGLVPLIRSARLHCYETALLGPERAGEMERELAAHAATEEDSQYIRGDLFCFEEFVLFLIFNDEENAHERVRAGIVYEAEMTDALKELNAFCRNVSEALSMLRDRAEDYMSEAIEWQQRSQDELPAASGFAPASRTDVAAGRAGVTLESARAAEVLEDTGARRLLRRISEAHADGSTADLLSSLRGKTETEALLRRMTETGLLRREVVISCRQGGRSLFRLPSPNALGAILASNAICSECSANIADEKIEELVVPTSVAATLLEDGSWLSDRVRLILLQLGIPEKQITVGAVAADGEAYMIASVCGEPFLFVLKDGDVTSAHARHALSKQNEVEATHLVVVATGKIQDEARERLREHARRRSRSESLVEVLLIEAVETAAGELQQAFERVSCRAVAEELSSLNSSLGLNVGSLLTTRFRLMRRSGALKDLATPVVGALAGNR
ncbi:MAG TPA: hypothetical protein VF658_19875 [Pyrinomonadaceae bacterium]|jgi:hypothetical protein